MALTNSSKHAPFQALSQLSVDAASFIPCQPGPPVYENAEQQAGHQRASTPIMPPSTTNQLPGYFVNCYPFMDIDPNTRFPGGGVTLSPGHANIQRKLVNGHVPSLILHKPPALVNEGNPFHVDVQWPPPVNSNLMAPSFLSAPVINPSLQMPFFSHINQQSRTQASYPSAPSIGPPLPQAYMGISPSVFGYNQSLQYIQGVQVPGYMYSSSTQTQGIWFPPGQEKSEDKTVKSQPKTKVIVCKDNSAQTDFNDELAQLTLAEKPNTLFIKDQATQGADSDSGYSSPLHRKNQATAAVLSSAPRPSTFRHPPPPSLPPPPPPQVSQVASQNSDFPHFAGPMYPHILPPTFPIPQFPGIVYPSPMQVYGSGESITNQCLSAVNRFPGMITNDHGSRFRQKQKSDRRASDGKSAASASKPLPGPAIEFVLRPQPTVCDDACPAATSTMPSGDQDVRLPFEDEDEFPILLSAAGGLVAQGECFGSSLSYGEILRSPSTQSTSRSRRSSASSSDKRRSTGSLPLSGGAGALVSGLSANKDSKSARKKQKRQLLAYQAAEDELAEISLEQQMLKELSTKQQKRTLFTVTDKAPVPKVPAPALPLAEAPPPAPPGAALPKVAAPPLFSIEDVIEQLEKEKSIEEREEMASPTQDSSKTATILDSNGTTKRAKEREFPNKKKPSSLKRVILKEREAKKCHSILDDCSSLLQDGNGAIVNGDGVTQGEGCGLLESLPVQAPTSAEMSPVSQMSPINMSPLSGSPAGSAGASPIAGDGTLGSGKFSVLSKIHSRRFREYCNQVLDKEIDDCCTELLQDLVRFQDRLYHDDPTKAKSKRRFVLGLREVTKHLKLGKLKCIIISPNLERIQSKGGLDDALNAIIEMSQKQDVPFVFALGRRALGRACAKLVPVSVVGVFSYDGSEENFFKLRDLTQKARDAYSEMVASLEREMAAAEPPATNTISTTAGSFEKLFPHLGHSRTPSACSAISFISSILSEPISENYPQSEPETDSRGYEIRLENRKPDLDTVGEGREETVELETEDKKVALNDEDIDDGHEADTEEDGVYSQPFCEADSPVVRESKEKVKVEPESCTDLATKLDPAGPTGAAIAARSEVTCSGHLAMSTIEPGVTNGSAKSPVQTAMSTSERSERIESWVAESQRVTKQLRELSSEAPTSAANADEEESGEEEEEEEVDEDAASLKTVEDDSSSEYEETMDVPFSSAVVTSP